MVSSSLQSKIFRRFFNARWLNYIHSTRRCYAIAAEESLAVQVAGRDFVRDSMTNVTPTVLSRVGRNLHQIPQHPLNIIKQRIVAHFQRSYAAPTGTPIFAHFDDLSPVVTTEQNFDSLLVPTDHASRSRSDNYYVNAPMYCGHTPLLTSEISWKGFDSFNRHELFSGCEKPEQLGLFEREPSLAVETCDKQAVHTMDSVKLTELSLKQTLTELVGELFGPETQMRWTPDYFPFTHPSYQLEVEYGGEWLEVLGSGVMQQAILDGSGAGDKIGWAFGLGLDRLAMLLFAIPDIRLFWSTDPRFLEQFRSVTLDPATDISFKPFSKYPSCYKDVAFWLPENAGDYVENDFFELVRSIGGDLVEKVELMDRFCHPVSSRVSHMYRIVYCSMERTLTNEEVNDLQDTLREGCLK
ncbi:Phenylalanine--tRNA ligase, mitochondrial [Geodia barretti]|uniref:phenylalanine--tRNA ligase n=1 Tax=Geodia barretti TaxID=519541 RepID=A0AA35RGJ8_GEOBA|nr:Phenylalanine--tRNA ligase, mitochondrial [Geodia barretti]